MNVAFILSVTTRLLFTLVSSVLFVPRAGLPHRLKALFLFSPVCSVIEAVLVYRAAPSLVAGALGSALYLVGIAVFLWAAWTHRHYRPSPIFSPDIPPRVVTNGPYRYVRHPFYSAYVIAFVAGVVASGGSLVLVVLLALNTALYARAAAAEEATLLTSASGDAYAAYRARTGMFFPRP